MPSADCCARFPMKVQLVEVTTFVPTYPAVYPIRVFPPPVVMALPALNPTAVLPTALVDVARTPEPTPVFSCPAPAAVSAYAPIPTLFVPVPPHALYPIAVLLFEETMAERAEIPTADRKSTRLNS